MLDGGDVDGDDRIAVFMIGLRDVRVMRDVDDKGVFESWGRISGWIGVGGGEWVRMRMWSLVMWTMSSPSWGRFV